MERVIQNFDALAENKLRRDALSIAEAGYEAIDVGNALRNKLKIENNELQIENQKYNLAARRIFFVGVGKCAFSAAKAAEEIFGDILTAGIALDVSQLEGTALKKIEVFIGTHPLPSEINVHATKRIIEFLSNQEKNDLVIMLVSGGGSALLCLPEEPMTFADESELFKELTSRGAEIRDINIVRKHLSRARGGSLARAAYPAEVLSLIVSDVPGNALEFISSGPTIMDSSTIADAKAVLAKYGVVPMKNIVFIETPKEEKYFERVANILFLTNHDALLAMRDEAMRREYEAEIIDEQFSGEAREISRGIVEKLHSTKSKTALLYAGESTVELGESSGVGLSTSLKAGGRNQELALAALENIRAGEIILPFASDGHDNTDHAGAIADSISASRANAKNISIQKYLDEHRSYDFFSATGDALITGYTGSNVSDLIIALKNKTYRMDEKKYILWMQDIGMDDVPAVGGKNASLGELIRSVVPKGVRVPKGFCVTADAYYYFLKQTGLDVFISKTLDKLDSKNFKELSRCGKLVRDKIRSTRLPADLEQMIVESYAQMEKEYGKNADVAVRSSATAEDLPGASFAGEHETYIGIRGAKDVVEATVWAMSSLFTDRAISYRADKGFEHTKVALSVGVQKMVRSDSGASGVMFTVDTESGFRDLVLINATWGLGELIVQGHVTPDEYLVMKSKIGKVKSPIIGKKLGVKNKKMLYALRKGGIKQTKIVQTTANEQTHFVLSEKEIEELARWGTLIEEHYSERLPAMPAHAGQAGAKTWTPMDMEWAKDGKTNELFIVQARPETVQARRDFSKLVEYKISGQGKILAQGISVGSKAATGVAHVIMNPREIKQFKKGEILVTTMTDPDWEPIMKMASAIVTDRGGRTSHAAIVSRELGLPAIVGAAGATKILKTGTIITVDTTGSAGVITAGKANIKISEHIIGSLPETKTKIMVNIASPDIAFEDSFLPVKGVGLAREEFIIASNIGVHPLAIINYKKLAPKLRAAIRKKITGWNNPVDFYIDNLAYGIAKIGAAFSPRPVIVRFSDFKTNEYATLLGGEAYEPREENPMLGWRGASRYYDPKFKDAFVLECRALVKVKEEMGMDNIIPMIPFCRTIKEAEQVLGIMEKNGIKKPVYMMCEIPSNILLAEEFLDLFDGMSIGSNDLTQLTLGLDRDSGIVTHIANENDESVRALISMIIRKCSARGKYLGICGQGPSDLPDFAEFLVKEGIPSMSLNPDSVIKTLEKVAEVEEKLM